MGMFHEPDWCGLRLWVEWLGEVLCPDCTRERIWAEEGLGMRGREVHSDRY